MIRKLQNKISLRLSDLEDCQNPGSGRKYPLESECSQALLPVEDAVGHSYVATLITKKQVSLWKPLADMVVPMQKNAMQ